MKIKFVSILLSMLIFNGCSPKVLEGTYQTYYEGGVLMAGEILQLDDEQRFFFKHWSDDVSSNKKGGGTYQANNGYLILSFEEIEEEKSMANQSIIPSTEEGKINYEISIYDNENEPLIGVSISLLDVNQQLIEAAVTNIEGRRNLQIEASNQPSKIDISYIGMEGLSLSLNDKQSKKIEITLVEKTKVWKAEDLLKYKYKVRGPYLILEDGERRKRKLKKTF